MPTLEERVAALEAQMATIENTKYEMSYSGESLEATLDFVNERNLISGIETATLESTQGSTQIYRLDLDISSSDFADTPTYAFELIRVHSTTEYKLSTSSMWLSIRGGGKYTIRASTTASIPESDTIKISYTFFAKTVN